MEDWTCPGQHKRHPEFPVVTRESRRNSRNTTWLPRHRKMKPFPATAPQEKSHVDRKSTLLNSSHQAISYAVFCLKKKKKRRKIDKKNKTGVNIKVHEEGLNEK